MLLSKPKLPELNQTTSGILLPYLPSKWPSVTWKTFDFALTHFTTSNFFGQPQTQFHSAIIAKKRFNASLIASSSSNPRKLWNSINTILERKPTPLLPSLVSSQSLSQMFATFFSDTILKLHTALKSSIFIASPLGLV